MTVVLRPLRSDEYDDWPEKSDAGYRHDMVEAGIDPEIAAAKSRDDHAALLPHGAETEGQLLYAIEADGEHVGTLWLAERVGNLGRSLFVYNINLDPAHRGRGLGRAAMELVEEQAQQRGLHTIELNVFGGNDTARGLYRSLGYEETAVTMRKRV